MSGFEGDPTGKSTLELCGDAFLVASGDDQRFKLDSYQLDTGAVWESCDYVTQPGNKIRIDRPSPETKDLMNLSVGPGSVNLEAIIQVNAALQFMVDLEGGDKFYARNRFVSIFILPEGVFVDFQPVAVRTYMTEQQDSREEVVPVGSLLRRISLDGDTVIQQLIDPAKVVSQASA